MHHTDRSVTSLGFSTSGDSRNAGPMPSKNFELSNDKYPESSSYVRFENDEASATETSRTSGERAMTSPDEVDITSGFGAYDLSLAAEQQRSLEDRTTAARGNQHESGSNMNSYSVA